MAYTVTSLRDEALYRLGDTANKIWSATEIDSYIRDGYLRLARLTHLFFSHEVLRVTADTATVTTPTEHLETERVLFDEERIEAAYPDDIRASFPRYRELSGSTTNYLISEEAAHTLRLVSIPTTTGDTYTFTGTWGTLRTYTDITTEAVSGSWGILRRLPGHHPSRGLWGIPRDVVEPGGNLQVEGYRQGLTIPDATSTLELPDRFCRYLRHFAMWRAFSRDGDGQDLALAKHYKERWEVSIELVKRRLRSSNRNRIGVLGAHTFKRFGGIRYPSLPWNYGRPLR